MSSARCRVCGVYSVVRNDQVVLYCIKGCPCDQPDLSAVLAEADATFSGGAEALIQHWESEWSDKRVK